MNNELQASQAWEAAVEFAIEGNSLSSLGRAFVRMAHPQAYADNIFLVSVTSNTVKDVIEKHALSVMESNLSDILGRDIHIDLSVDPTINERKPRTHVEEPVSSPVHSFSPYMETPQEIPAEIHVTVQDHLLEDTDPIPAITLSEELSSVSQT
ncbi:MAG: hypothetical protein IKZ87_02620, partial [Actinomycetaceae bacterium]|nr:hypothetical protein [Actinomycetaceae bacterium]